MAEISEDYWALRRTAGAVWLAQDFLRVHGPETFTYLQGQLSQDVSRLVEGQAVDSFLLQPQGKVDALVRVVRTGQEEAVIQVEAGFGEAVLARLTRFKLRVKADVEPLTWKCLAVRGPEARRMPVTEGTGMGGIVVDDDWPGLPGVDVLGAEPAVPDGVRLCSQEAWEAVRIEAGVPVMGRELGEKTIPAEAGIVDRTVSFTKGCYTGQELVARIDSRGGNVPRRLRGVIVPSESDPPPPGAALVIQGKEVGSITSVAWSPGLGAGVALAYVRREVEPPAESEVQWDGASAPARIEALPLSG